MVFQIINPLILVRIPEEYGPLEAERKALQARIDHVDQVRTNISYSECRTMLEGGVISEDDDDNMIARQLTAVNRLREVEAQIALLRKTEAFTARTLAPSI